MEKRNILTSKLPDFITVSGRRIQIETDFRRWITVTRILTDYAENESGECVGLSDIASSCALVICPDEIYPSECAEFLRGAAEFASCGYGGENAAEGAEGKGERLIDFDTDAELILGAFLSSYGIDLTVTKMHWHKFIALLRALPEDTELKRVMRLREADLGGIRDDELRRRMRRAKAAVRIRRKRRDTDKCGEEAVNGG